MADELEKFIRKLFAPIVVFNGFEDIVTEKIAIKVMTERFSNLLSETATDYEALVYLHTASLAAPLSEEWQNIYAYLFSKYHPKEARKIGVYRDELTELERRKLADLKKWIYKRQMNPGR